MFITEHIGKKGLRGADGSNGLGVSTQSGARISSPYLSAFRKNKIDSAVTWTRATEAAFQNRYNLQETIQPSVTEQVINYTTVDEVNWLDPFGYNVWQVTGTGVSDPFDGTDAVQLTIGDTTLPGRDYTLLAAPVGVNVGGTYRVSFYAQLVSGTITSCKAGINNISAIPDGNVDISLLDSNWRRFSAITSSNVDNEFNLYFETTGAVINIYQINATEGTKLYDHVPAIGDAPVAFETDSLIYRENDKGFIIQPESTNLCLYSEDFREWSVTGGASVSLNTAFDSFEAGGSFTRLTFASASPCTLSISGLSLSAGTEYTVSFLALLENGTIESIGVSLGGGEVAGASASTVNTRQAVKCIAGAGNSITITLTTSVSGTVLVLAGVQVEQSEATGYIPTRISSRTRSADIVSADIAELPSLAQPFSVHCKWFDIRQTNAAKYLFNIGGSFTAYIIGANIIVFGGGVELINTPLTDIETGEIFIVFDGANLSVNTNTAQLATAAYTGETVKPTYFYIGSNDNAGSNVLNGAFSDLTFWPFALTQNEMKYIGGF